MWVYYKLVNFLKLFVSIKLKSMELSLVRKQQHKTNYMLVYNKTTGLKPNKSYTLSTLWN